MKFLSKKQADELLNLMRQAANGGSERWNEYQDETDHIKATLLIPLGELMNEGIMGFVWAWKMKGLIHTCPIPENARLKAQGLEGAFTIETTLVAALIVYSELPPHRCAISISFN